mgnify:FL=1
MAAVTGRSAEAPPARPAHLETGGPAAAPEDVAAGMTFGYKRPFGRRAPADPEGFPSMLDFVLVLQMFALVNPLTSMPFLVTAHSEGANVRKIAVRAVVVAFFLGVVMVCAGPWLFGVFGITLDSFRVAGGVVLLLLGIRMVTPGQEEERLPDLSDSAIAIMATPLLTGPATISFVTIKAFELGRLAVLSNLCVTFVLVAAVFLLFSLAIDRINAKVIDILSRVMGLFLTAVAIELVARGLEGITLTAAARHQQGV